MAVFTLAASVSTGNNEYVNYVNTTGAPVTLLVEVDFYSPGTVTCVEGGLEIPNDEGTNTTVIANCCAIVRLDI